MLHTCNQVQQELLPLYFSIITPLLRMPSPDSLRTRTFTHLLQSEVVAWLDRKGPDAADYFHAISLTSFDRPYIDCSVKVLRSMVVEQSSTQTGGSKATKPLQHWSAGLRHFELAEEAIEQLQRKSESLN
ncbi:hypothetical protein D6C92_09152 [Aureobasidium pullulans]|nr:hypothetical protein D6C92_09152 [Aureobasidium pullulans]